MFKKLLILVSVLALASSCKHHHKEKSSKSNEQKVVFDFQNHVLSKDAKKILDEQVTKIKSSTDQVEIAANCDKSRSGSKKYNIDIAKRRAEAIEKYLIKNDISKSRIKISADGADRGNNKNFKSANTCSLAITTR